MRHLHPGRRELTGDVEECLLLDLVVGYTRVGALVIDGQVLHQQLPPKVGQFILLGVGDVNEL